MYRPGKVVAQVFPLRIWSKTPIWTFQSTFRQSLNQPDSKAACEHQMTRTVVCAVVLLGYVGACFVLEECSVKYLTAWSGILLKM
jgi:hypothetical protein